MGPEEGTVWHDRHAERHPEEQGCHEASPPIVGGILYRGLDET